MVGDEVLSEPFSASARPTPSAEEVAERTRKAQEEHTNSLRPLDGDTPAQLGAKLLTLACIYEPSPVHAEIIQQLLDLGADVNYRGSDNRTPLINAAHAANEWLVKTLLDKGADPNASDNPGGEDKLGPAICHASYRCSAPVIRMLLEAGADPNASCHEYGRTALHLAIDYARVAIDAPPPDAVIALVEGGAALELESPKGYSPLRISLASKMPETVKYLISKGADPERPSGGETPLKIARIICPTAEPIITEAIAAKRVHEKTVKAEHEHLDQWMKDGCPATGGAKPMPTLKLRPKAGL